MPSCKSMARFHSRCKFSNPLPQNLENSKKNTLLRKNYFIIIIRAMFGFVFVAFRVNQPVYFLNEIIAKHFHLCKDYQCIFATTYA